MTRREELAAEAREAGLFVRFYSPGDGVTRYRFFDLTRSDETRQSYFGPDNGIYTALGLKEARTFVAGRERSARLARIEAVYPEAAAEARAAQSYRKGMEG